MNASLDSSQEEIAAIVAVSRFRAFMGTLAPARLEFAELRRRNGALRPRRSACGRAAAVLSASFRAAVPARWELRFDGNSTGHGASEHRTDRTDFVFGLYVNLIAFAAASRMLLRPIAVFSSRRRATPNTRAASSSSVSSTSSGSIRSTDAHGMFARPEERQRGALLHRLPAAHVLFLPLSHTRCSRVCPPPGQQRHGRGPEGAQSEVTGPAGSPPSPGLGEALAACGPWDPGGHGLR